MAKKQKTHAQSAPKSDPLGEDTREKPPKKMGRKAYKKELARLQGELVKMQEWIWQEQIKVVVTFDGRDTAGKGGIIKRIVERLNPRICRRVALTKPTEREQSQWYFKITGVRGVMTKSHLEERNLL